MNQLDLCRCISGMWNCSQPVAERYLHTPHTWSWPRCVFKLCPLQREHCCSHLCRVTPGASAWVRMPKGGSSMATHNLPIVFKIILWNFTSLFWLGPTRHYCWSINLRIDGEEGETHTRGFRALCSYEFSEVRQIEPFHPHKGNIKLRKCFFSSNNQKIH